VKRTLAEILKILDAAATANGIEPSLLRGVAYVESRFKPDAVSPVGARGLLQMLDATAADMGCVDPFDPVQNANAGAKYLALMLRRFNNDESAALAAYCWGFKKVERAGSKWPASVSSYVRRVQQRALVEREIVGLVGDHARRCPVCNSPIDHALEVKPTTAH
jgi:soluble lytic murein transglycosylase-like protein